jgi:hypothetical protein
VIGLAKQVTVVLPLLLQREHTACLSTPTASHRANPATPACRARRRGTTHVRYTLADKARIDSLRDLVEGSQGEFRLKITPKCAWVTEPLEYTFTVSGLHTLAGLVFGNCTAGCITGRSVALGRLAAFQQCCQCDPVVLSRLPQVAGNQAQTLEAGWCASSVEGGGAVPRVRLGDQLPVLEVRAKDSSGQVRARRQCKQPLRKEPTLDGGVDAAACLRLALTECSGTAQLDAPPKSTCGDVCLLCVVVQSVGFPFASPQEVRQAVTLSLQKTPGRGQLTFTGEDFRLSNDRQLISITG